MTNCAGAIILPSNRNVNKNIKISIGSKKKKTIMEIIKVYVTIYNSCTWDKN